MKRLIPLLLAFGLLGTACKKSKDAPPPPPPPLTKENVVGAYKITADVITSTDGVSTDNFSTYQPCVKDDTWTFNTDNSLNVTDDGVVCDPGDVWSSTWTLDGEAIDIAGMIGTVTKWDGKTMEVTIVLEDGSKDKITFKKQ